MKTLTKSKITPPAAGTPAGNVYRKAVNELNAAKNKNDQKPGKVKTSKLPDWAKHAPGSIAANSVSHAMVSANLVDDKNHNSKDALITKIGNHLQTQKKTINDPMKGASKRPVDSQGFTIYKYSEVLTKGNFDYTLDGQRITNSKYKVVPDSNYDKYLTNKS